MTIRRHIKSYSVVVNTNDIRMRTPTPTPALPLRPAVNEITWEDKEGYKARGKKGGRMTVDEMLERAIRLRGTDRFVEAEVCRKVLAKRKW